MTPYGHDPSASSTPLPSDVEVLRLLEELEQRNAQLEAGVAELRHFAELAAHDLRSPLTVVRGYLEQVRRIHGAELSEQAREWLDAAVAATIKMGNLIDSLLGHATSAGAPLDVAEVSLDDVFRDALDALAPTITSTRAEIHVGLLPTVNGDRQLLSVVAQNLVGNALKFARPGVTPRVEVTAVSEPPTSELSGRGWVVVSVSDNGIGIDEADRHRVFGLFTRSAPSGYGGSGIGLATCARIVERHGGHIWVADSEAPGARIAFRLPLADEPRR